MTPRHIVVLSYFHPPFPTSGGNRWVAMARHLRAAGHRVTFVASDAFGSLPDDERQGVVRARDLKSAGILRRVLRRGGLPPVGAGAVEEPPAPAVLTKVLVPDAHVVSWLPAAVAALAKLLRRDPPDCVVTTGPPDSVHLAGLLAGPRRPAWVVDFRDGWTFEPLREPFPTRPQRELDRWLERRVVFTADAVATVNGAIAGDLRARLGIDAAIVRNGYDPALDEEAATAPLPPLPSGRRIIAHTGALSGSWGRDAGPLLRSLAGLDEDVAQRLVLVQAGPTSPADAPLLEALSRRGIVRMLGVVPRATAIALQRRADALLLLTSRNSGESTGKLYEYLAARRPILALAEDNAAAETIRRTGTGRLVAPDDEPAITDELRRLALADEVDGVDPHGIDAYVYPGPALAMAALVETAIARRAER